MNIHELKEWLVDNLPDWPEHKNQCMNVPFGSWHWWVVDHNVVILNIETGEFVNKEQFFDYRSENRFKTCGMGFNEMIQDLWH